MITYKSLTGKTVSVGRHQITSLGTDFTYPVPELDDLIGVTIEAINHPGFGGAIDTPEELAAQALCVTASGAKIAGQTPTQTQAAMVRAGISEYIFSGLATQPVKRILWWGDSTTEAASGGGYIPVEWAKSIGFDPMPGVTLHKNYGANGYTAAAILSAAAGAVNGSGNVITPEGVGTECVSVGVDVLAICFGINDFRLNADVSTYGSPAMIAAVQLLQSRLVNIVSRARAVSPNTKVLFHVPNTLCLTGALLSVSGQSVTDALRATYLGDNYLGIKAISDLVPVSTVCDSGSAVFGIVSPATAAKPIHMADELHPNTTGYRLRHLYIAAWLADQKLVDAYSTVAVGQVGSSAATYTDLNFIERTARLFGNVSGTGYGALSSPNLGVGDEFLFTTGLGTQKVLIVKKNPYQNAAENYIRWTGGPTLGIDGSYHETDIPSGSSLVLRRKVIRNVFEALAQRDGFHIYPIRVTAGASGSLTIRGIPGAYDLATRAPTTTDFLALAPVGGATSSGVLGLALTGATIGAAAGAVGGFTITLAGTNFTHAVNQLGSILVPV